MIYERLIKIINHKFQVREVNKLLEEQTGISAQQWSHVRNGRTTPDVKHIEAIGTLFPEYAYWIMTGKTIPEAGQTSPDLEQLEELKRAVNDH